MMGNHSALSLHERKLSCNLYKQQQNPPTWYNRGMAIKHNWNFRRQFVMVMSPQSPLSRETSSLIQQTIFEMIGRDIFLN